MPQTDANIIRAATVAWFQIEAGRSPDLEPLRAAIALSDLSDGDANDLVTMALKTASTYPEKGTKQ